jgi:acetyltransferase-like isoleucine patch superfamily enzyme
MSLKNKIIPGDISILAKRIRNQVEASRKLKQQGNLSYAFKAYLDGDCRFEPTVRITGKDVYLRNVSIGKYSYLGGYSSIIDCSIGRYCSIASYVLIGLGVHPSKNAVSTHPAFYSTLGQAGITYADKQYFQETQPITIGNDVWIGARAIIRDGVKIGDGAIIGAGAVVVKDVAPYSVVGGVPAELIRYRFSRPEINFLLKFKWWDREDAWVRANWRDFLDIKKFKKANENITDK